MQGGEAGPARRQAGQGHQGQKRQRVSALELQNPLAQISQSISHLSIAEESQGECRRLEICTIASEASRTTTAGRRSGSACSGGRVEQESSLDYLLGCHRPRMCPTSGPEMTHGCRDPSVHPKEHGQKHLKEHSQRYLHENGQEEEIVLPSWEPHPTCRHDPHHQGDIRQVRHLRPAGPGDGHQVCQGSCRTLHGYGVPAT